MLELDVRILDIKVITIRRTIIFIRWINGTLENLTPPNSSNLTFFTLKSESAVHNNNNCIFQLHLRSQSNCVWHLMAFNSERVMWLHAYKQIFDWSKMNSKGLFQAQIKSGFRLQYEWPRLAPGMTDGSLFLCDSETFWFSVMVRTYNMPQAKSDCLYQI